MPSKLVWERLPDIGNFFQVPGGKILQIPAFLSRKTFLKAEIFGRSAAAVLFIEWKSIKGFIILHSL